MVYQVKAQDIVPQCAEFIQEGEVIIDGPAAWRIEYVKDGADGIVRTVEVQVGEGGRRSKDYPAGEVVQVAGDYEAFTDKWAEAEPFYRVEVV